MHWDRERKADIYPTGIARYENPLNMHSITCLCQLLEEEEHELIDLQSS